MPRIRCSTHARFWKFHNNLKFTSTFDYRIHFDRNIPVSCSSLRSRASLWDINGIHTARAYWQRFSTRNGQISRTFHVVESRVERQTGAHPKEHVRSQVVARRPEVVFRVTYKVSTHLQHILYTQRLRNSKNMWCWMDNSQQAPTCMATTRSIESITHRRIVRCNLSKKTKIDRGISKRKKSTRTKRKKWPSRIIRHGDSSR